MGGIASGLGDIGSGVASLFSGDQTPAAGQPGGPELVGPPSPYASPNFMQGLRKGSWARRPARRRADGSGRQDWRLAWCGCWLGISSGPATPRR